VDGLWVGLALSLLLHLVGVPVVIGLERRAARNAERAVLAEPLTESQVLPEQSRLGIERSDHATITWIGFADPTPHKAIPSEIEQAALSTAPLGRLEEPPTPISPTERPTEAPPVEASPSQPTDRPEPARSAAPPPASPAPREVSQMPWAPDAKPVEETPEFLPEPAQPDANPPQEPVTPETAAADAPAEPAEDAAPPAQPEPVPSQPPPSPTASPAGADDLPGQPSDRESAPFAKEMALTLDDWGRPAAGEGIEVIPRRPRWGPTVASLAWPRNPTVIIDFDRRGTVRNVRFATVGQRVLNTGSDEVDRVLINTIYNWRAKGQKIEALPESGPGSLFTIRMAIRLRW